MGPYATEVAPAASKTSAATATAPAMSWAAMATRKASPAQQQQSVQNTSDYSVKIVDKPVAKKPDFPSLKPSPPKTTTATTTASPLAKTTPAEKKLEQIVQPAVPKTNLVVEKLNRELEMKKKKKKAKKERQLAKSKLNMVMNGSCAMVEPESPSSSGASTPKRTGTPVVGGISKLMAADMERTGSNNSVKMSSPLKQNITSAPHAGYDMERGGSNDSKSTMASGIGGSRQAYDMSRIGSNASSTSTAPPISGFSKLKDDVVAGGSAVMMERVPSNKMTMSPQTTGINQLRDQISELNIGTNPSRSMSYLQTIKNGINRITGSGATSGYTTPGQMSSAGDPEVSIPITGFSGTTTPMPVPDRQDSGIAGINSPPSDKTKPAIGKRCASDFDVLRCLGKGAFGTVHLVREKATGRLYAQKQFKKASLRLKNSVVAQTMSERQILELVNRHPFIVKLYYAFQDQEKLYLILEYGSGGELFWHVNARDQFNEDEARFYVAETLLAVEHLHKNLKVVYRDLKPENCLLDAEGHLLLTDFGLSKVAVEGECKSILGTKDYMAPEVIKGKTYGYASDFWALGCFAFHLMTGQPPFFSANDAKTEQKILHGKLKFPIWFSPYAKDLFTRLLRREPKKRLGYNWVDDMKTIKNHNFFKGIDWSALERREVQPPIVPMIANPEDAENFEKQFTELPLSPVVDRGVWDGMKHHDDPFGGFSYVARASMFERHGDFGGRGSGDEEVVEDDIDSAIADDGYDAELERKRARTLSFDSMKSF